MQRRRTAALAGGLAGGLALFAASAAASPPDPANPAAPPVDSFAERFPGCAGPGTPTTVTSTPVTTTSVTTATSVPPGVPDATVSTLAPPTIPDGTEGPAGAVVPGSAALADARFLRAAADAGRFEVLSATLAAERASDGEVRAFAARLAAEHSDQNERLLALAVTVGVEVGAEPCPAVQAALDDLAAVPAAEFDAAFLAAQADAHRHAIDRFDDEARTGSDTCVRAFAAAGLPILADHLSEAYTLQLLATGAPSAPSTSLPATSAPATATSAPTTVTTASSGS